MHCNICYSLRVDTWMVCDICEEYYCEDCSYTFGIHYQFQGSRCYQCADQYRRTSLTKEEKRNNKLIILGLE